MSIRSILVLFVLLVPITSRAQTPGISLEKFTGAWCGWCPYGATVLDSVQERLGDRAVVLAWHFNDVLEARAVDTIAKQVSDGGHPVVSINRRPVISNGPLDFNDQHPWLVKTLDRLQLEPAATPAIENISYIEESRVLYFMPTFSPVIPEWPGTGVPMTVGILTEDDVLLDQSLYNKDGSPLPKLLDYPHQNVVRQVAGKVLGDSMHYAWGPGWYFQTYEMIVNPKWDVSKTRLNIIFLVRNEDGSFTTIRALKSRYLSEFGTMSVGREESALVNIYPNPASRLVHIDLVKDADAQVTIYNSIGQHIMSQRLITASTIDVSDLPPGAYVLTVNTARGLSRHSLIVR